MASRSPSSSLEVQRRKPNTGNARRNLQPASTPAEVAHVAAIEPEVKKVEKIPEEVSKPVEDSVKATEDQQPKSKSDENKNKLEERGSRKEEPRNRRSPDRRKENNSHHSSRNQHHNHHHSNSSNQYNHRRSRSRSTSKDRKYSRRSRSPPRQSSRRPNNYRSNRSRSRSPHSRNNHSHHQRRRSPYVSEERRGPPRNNQRESPLKIRQNYDNLYGKKDEKEQQQKRKPAEEENIIKEQPCWVVSGILARFQNSLNGVPLKFTRPMDAEKPKDKWTLFPFKGDEKFDKVSLRGDSAFLIGKDERVAVILCENPSVSGQHAVIQFREIRQMDYGQGEYTSEIRPYIMDLESTNGTLLNGDKIDPAKYIQLLPNDILRFGLSTRDFVLIKEK